MTSRATRLWVRAERRRRRAGLVALAVLTGLAVSTVLAATAGARRTVTTYDRFAEQIGAAHANVQLSLDGDLSGRTDVDLGGGRTALEVVEELRASQLVEAIGLGAIVHAAPEGFEPGGDFFSMVVLDEGPSTVDRLRVLRGRLPEAAGELALNERAVAALGLDIGDRTTLKSRSADQMERLILQADMSVVQESPAGPEFPGRVVGVVRGAGDIGGTNLVGPYALISKAAYEERRRDVGQFSPMVYVRLQDGYGGLPALRREVRRLAGPSPSYSVQDKRVDTDAIQDALDIQGLALLLLAGFAAVAGMVAFATALSRQLALSASDDDVLRSLGVARAERARALTTVAAPAVAGGIAASVVAAIAASPLLPVGLGRAAEPDPGVEVDVAVLALGAGLALVVLGAIAASTAWRATARRPSALIAPPRPGPVTRWARPLNLRAVTATGLRLVFEPGRGPAAVPSRPALVAAVVAVAGVTAVATFGTSLRHVLDTPALSGFPWHAELGGGEDRAGVDETLERARSDRDIDAALLARFAPVRIKGEDVPGYGAEVVKGDTGFTILDGRRPAAPDEVALGPATMRTFGVGIGERVRIDGAERALRIVGQAIFPIIDNAAYASGALFTAEGLDAVADEGGFYEVLVRFGPGVDVEAKRKELEDELGFLYEIAAPPEVANLREAERFPAALAAFLALIGLAAVVHALLAVVRRRRRDLAVLRTLGLVRGQVRGVIAVQATALVITGLLVGLPLGLAAGRSTWRVVASGLDVVVQPQVPALSLALMAVAAIILVNTVAAVPAIRATRIRPATVLRTE